MDSIRSAIWCAAFVRRHNDLGHICVLSKKGDPVAGQVWIEVDHLDGSASLFSPAPALLRPEGELDWVFQCRFERAPVEKISRRISQPKGEHGLSVV